MISELAQAYRIRPQLTSRLRRVSILNTSLPFDHVLPRVPGNVIANRVHSMRNSDSFTSNPMLYEKIEGASSSSRREMRADWDHTLCARRQRELPEIRRTTIWYHPRSESELDRIAMLSIKKQYLGRLELGVPDMYAWCRNRVGHLVNYIGIEREKGQLRPDIMASRLTASKRTSCVHAYPNRLCGMKVRDPNPAWAYRACVPVSVRLMYSFSIIELLRSYLIGWEASSTMEDSLGRQVYKYCVHRLGSPEIINMDQGFQVGSSVWVDTVNS